MATKSTFLVFTIIINVPIIVLVYVMILDKNVHDSKTDLYVDSALDRTGPKVIKSTQLSTKFILLINVKMPTIVGILTFISMINTTPEILKARNFLICR